MGFEEPVLWSKIRWTITRAVIIKGRIKCNEKNRFKVGWDTEKFPHTQVVTCGPKYGMAEIILVITVAPQKDICPQGRTYPMKAVIIVRSRIITPDPHTIGILIGELK